MKSAHAHPSQSLDRRAVVVGAGLAGLAAAAGIADNFDQVLVVERDKLPHYPSARPGLPQSNQLHGLLAGGLDALMKLFPGFDRDLAAAGAIKSRVGLDDNIELPGHDPFPNRDLGLIAYTMSRPLLEFLVRRRVQQLPNVRLQERCRAVSSVASPDKLAWSVHCEHADGKEEVLPADLVVDASGRGTLTRSALKSVNYSAPEQTVVGVDIQYATTTFAAPDHQRGRKLAITFPDGRSDTKTGYLFEVEGGRWTALISERHRSPPSPSVEDFIALAQRLRTPTIYNLIRSAQSLDRVHRFSFPESRRWHYERLTGFPRGLLPIGDAICQFNPIYGQGMSMAAKEAVILKNVLARRGAEHPTIGLAEAFFADAAPWIEAAWSMSATPDFAHPETRGERPADLARTLRFTSALYRLAARDAELHRTTTQVRHLMTLPTALQDPELVQRVEAEMASV